MEEKRPKSSLEEQGAYLAGASTRIKQEGEEGYGEKPETKEYTVKPGETLTSIAEDHGVTPQAILQASGLSSAEVVTPGKKLKIPVKKE